MTPSELKYNVQATGRETHFFDYKTMHFFGDTMRNYGCRSVIHDGLDCWELYRKRPVKHGVTGSHFFAKSDFSWQGTSK